MAGKPHEFFFQKHVLSQKDNQINTDHFFSALGKAALRQNIFLLTPIRDSMTLNTLNFTGIRMLDGKATDTLEGSSLSYRSDYIDIYSCCWGPKDDGKRFGKPGYLASKALQIGAERVNLETLLKQILI